MNITTNKMGTLNFLNTREVKRLKEILIQQFGYALQEDYAYVQNEKDRVFIVTKEITKIDLTKIRLDRIGLYFAEYKNTQVRLSKEGAALLVEEARKHHQVVQNILDLSADELKQYFKGEDLPKDLGEERKLVLLQYGSDIIGCASYKEKVILNFLPRIHRGEVIV